MYCTQWSRSAGFASGPFLSMMRRQASCVRIVMWRMSSADLPRCAKLRVQLHRRFHGRLRVKLRRIADLEQHVLHHVGAIRPLELELLPLERNVVEAPGLRGQRRRIAHLARSRHQRQPHGAAGRIARGPALARAGVGRVAIGAQALPIHPRQRERVQWSARASGQATGSQRPSTPPSPAPRDRGRLC